MVYRARVPYVLKMQFTAHKNFVFNLFTLFPVEISKTRWPSSENDVLVYLILVQIYFFMLTNCTTSIYGAGECVYKNTRGK